MYGYFQTEPLPAIRMRNMHYRSQVMAIYHSATRFLAK